MQIDPVYSITFLLLTVITIYFSVKRMDGKGCITYGYVWLVIFSINLLTITSLFFMYSSTSDVYAISTSGKQYTANVISYTEEEKYDSDNDSHYTMYRPTVQFTTEKGDVIEKELDFSTSGLEIGDSYHVNYNEETNEVITLGFTLIIKVIGSLIFGVIFSFLFVGILMYALGYDMDNYKKLVSKVGFNFFIPFLMIGFNALLIYAIFYGNSVPIFITGLLVFFVLVLTLAIWGYIKMIFSQGTPKLTQVGPNKWVSDWDNSDERKQK